MAPYLEHANITVASIDKALEFLTTAFPHFTIRGEGETVRDFARWHWAHVGDDRFYIALQENAEHQPKPGRSYLHDGINHLGIVVEDLEAIKKRLEKKNYRAGEFNADHPHRKRMYYFDDLGFEWEFIEYLSDKNNERNDYSQA